MRQKLQLLLVLFCGALLIALFAYSEQSKGNHIVYNGRDYPLYPTNLDTCPNVPSPFVTRDSMEIVLGYWSMDSTYTLIPVTVENGEPLNYAENRWGKGRQLEVDGADFPTLVRTGLHSELELDRTTSITGRQVAEITEDGRPGRSSRAGFMSHDEDIISVLKADNRLAKKLELTHPQLARPMFHLWNIIQKHDERMRLLGRPLQGIDLFYYRGRKVHLLDAGCGHGWQQSIFRDGIMGMWQIEITRDLDPDEEAFLKNKYSHLDLEQMTRMVEKLSYIHTGEMVPYYIMRYGFYEGHTSYRADPIAIAFIFSLRTIEEIDEAVDGDLYGALTSHFTQDNVGKETDEGGNR